LEPDVQWSAHLSNTPSQGCPPRGNVIPFPSAIAPRWAETVLYYQRGLSDRQRKICYLILKYGLARRPWRPKQAEFACMVGIKRRMLIYHVKALEQQEWIITDRRQYGMRYWPGPRLLKAVMRKERRT